MKRIYPAGPFSWQQRILAHARELEALGYEITGQWLTQEAQFTRPDNSTVVAAGLHQHCYSLSIRDLENIASSDTLILFEPGVAIERNTRVAEFGAALAWGLQCIVIQPPDEDKKDVISSIFVKLDTIPQTWDARTNSGEARVFNRVGKIKPVKEFRNWEAFMLEVPRLNAPST